MTSRGPGWVVFAAFFLFTAAVHGHFHLATLRTPFPALATLLAGLLASVLPAEPERGAALAVVTAAGMFGALTLGTFAQRSCQARAELEGLRAAVQAQMLAQSRRRLQALSGTLDDLRGRTHDMGSSLLVANLSVDHLKQLAERVPPDQRDDTRQELDRLETSLRHVKELARAISRASPATPSQADPVDVREVLAWVQESLRPRFHSAEVVVRAPENLPRVAMPGGGNTLRRVLENLVSNACEGDGLRGATRVELRLEQTPAGELSLEVADNGPGFKPEQLARPIDGFATTKQQGTGLGLYTAERLVLASGGRLERSNTPGGGASVRVRLPLGRS
jgi:signal transduction histidine kinase